jgi:ABC-type sugar transport system ATPase subunit
MDALVAEMLGRDPEKLEIRQGGIAKPDRSPVLRVEGVCRLPNLKSVSLDVHAGEILCITGSMASGRRELARCMSGMQKPSHGAVSIDGRPLAGPRDAIRRGVCFLPEDRKREGLLHELTVFDNLVLGRVVTGRNPLLRLRGLRSEAKRMIARLHIRTRSMTSPVRVLSGGNQQKVILGRWLAVGARVLVFDEPTAGIDVGTKLEIYRLLRELADAGTAVVLFSSDYEEIRLAADRVIVLRRGEIAGEMSGEDVTEERLLALELAPLS